MISVCHAHKVTSLEHERSITDYGSMAELDPSSLLASVKGGQIREQIRARLRQKKSESRKMVGGHRKSFY